MNQNYETTILKIIKTYQDFIIINLASHIHVAQIKAPQRKDVPGLDLVVFNTQSISPIFNNNPSFNILYIEQILTINDMHSHHF